MSTLSDVGTGAATGATLGSVVPGVGTAIGGAVGAVAGLTPTLFKLFMGDSQKKKANSINPMDPGYVMNQGVLQNQRILGDRYNNYTLPGYTQTKTNIDNTYQNAFAQGSQGASSGGDIADLAARLAYGKNIAEQSLEAKNAEGKDGALTPYLQANEAAGQQFQNKNTYDQQLYQAQLKEKAALTQAGNTNEYNAIDTGASVLSGYLNPKSTTTDFTNNNIGKAKKQSSIFESANPYATTGSPSNTDWSQLYSRYPTTN